VLVLLIQLKKIRLGKSAAGMLGELKVLAILDQKKWVQLAVSYLENSSSVHSQVSRKAKIRKLLFIKRRSSGKQESFAYNKSMNVLESFNNILLQIEIININKACEILLAV